MPRKGLAVLGGIVGALLCLWAIQVTSVAERARERNRMERETQVLASQVAQRMRANLELHRIGLEQMANFYENSEEVTKDEFETFATRTMDLAPRFLRIVAIDPASRVRWVHPEAPNRALLGTDLTEHEEGYATILRAREAGTAVLSPPITLLDGSPGFVMVAPIVRRGKRIGEIAGTFRTDEFFDQVDQAGTLRRYDERILDAGETIFSSGSFHDEGAETDAPPAVSESLEIGGRTWEVHLAPKREILRDEMGGGWIAFWVLGGLLAVSAGVFSGGAVYAGLALLARFRSQGEALAETREHLEAAREQLVQADKLTAVGELVAGVAHELNNPLATILGYAEILSSSESRGEARQRLDVIRSEAERAGKIVRNLLTFARKHPPEKKKAQLNDVVERTLELKEYHVRSSGIEIDRDLDPNLPVTRLDFHQIQQVILNLLNNAEQAIAGEGSEGTIRVSTRVERAMLELRVTDDGPGIPAEIREKIFEPFFTTKKVGQGTGLGLPLCFGIVSEHGGTLGVESAPGRGTTFIVRLPISEDSGSRPVASPAADGTPKGFRILVVEDEPAVRAPLVEMLQKRGHAVSAASDVREAIEKIDEGRLDLVISDMKMPGGSGRDLQAAIAARAPSLARRIIFATGDGGREETQRFAATAGAVLITKPFSAEELERAIDEATRR